MVEWLDPRLEWRGGGDLRVSCQQPLGVWWWWGGGGGPES